MLTGNVGKDPEVTYNANGTVIATMVLATNDGYRDRSGQWVDRTTWHNLSCWGELAKRVEKHIQKGTNISVHGRIAVDTWIDNEGKKHYKTYVQINEFRTNRNGKMTDQDFNNELTTAG